MTIKKEKVAKFFRIITVPPVLITALIIILLLSGDDIFGGFPDIIISFLLLGIIPILAYPLQQLLPGFKERGREGQRKLAFILNIIGYTLAVILGFMMDVQRKLMLIYITYFLSVVILTIFNLLHIRASGHACSATGPLIFLIYYTGWKTLLPCLITGAAIVWSSLELKRHTRSELAIGALCCLAAFLISQCII